MQRQDPDSFFGECRPQFFIPAAILVINQAMGIQRDQLAFFCQCGTVSSALSMTVFQLLKKRRDPHLEKFVKVAGGDSQKLQSLQQWIGLILGFLQNPPVKSEPGFLSV